MPTDLLKSLIDALKLIPRYAAPLGICLGIVLLSPAQWLQRIGIGQLAENHRTGLGLGLVLCCSLVVFSVFGMLVGHIQKWLWRRRRNRKILRRLAGLNEDEKQILRYYLALKTRSNRLRIDDGIVQGLVASGLLYRSTTLGNLSEGFDHNIAEFAWEVLNKDPGLLEGSTNVYRTDKERSRW